jgi:hypothetical protein
MWPVVRVHRLGFVVAALGCRASSDRAREPAGICAIKALARAGWRPLAMTRLTFSGLLQGLVVRTRVSLSILVSSV